ncbi:hypothetical protein MTR67_025592 [Solanum verrucosum]|uniref:Uncharacterized protein n=1 Tax=Solanum verrucosum TaxID=315347 RepID=A0AAF0R1B5_SOLVR|nr:hypothetical protein MTR67_025592 [Solanum verrucosum]
MSGKKSDESSLQGPSHCWFNGIPDKKSLKDGILLVLVAGFVDSSSITEANFVSMLEKVKFPQLRYPFLQIIGFQDTKIPLCSIDICTHLLGRTLKEYIAFPILLANKDVLELTLEQLRTCKREPRPSEYNGKRFRALLSGDRVAPGINS